MRKGARSRSPLRCHASVKSYRRQILQVTENKEKYFGICQADIAKKAVTG